MPFHELEPRRARDIISLGQDVGRVLSDGRVVGRAEPFAKVFPSSRVVKRAVGPTAWCVLEDIGLDARLDDRGRLVAETNARRIAGHLGLNKGTVVTHLGRLRDYGFIFHEELRQDGSGRYDTARYVLDPSACLERFTHTPTGADPRTENPYTVAAVDGKPVHGSAVHGKSVQQLRDLVGSRRQQQQDGPPIDELAAELERLGVDRAVAADLVAGQTPDRVREALEAAATESVRNPAAWVVGALREGWDFNGRLAAHREAVTRRQKEAQQAAADQAAARFRQERGARVAGWCAAVSAALDDDALRLALVRVTTPAPVLGRRLVPLACAQLLAWAVTIHRRNPSVSLRDALEAALAGGVCGPPAHDLDESLPVPPPVESSAGDLSARIAACLQHLNDDGDGEAARRPQPCKEQP